MIDFALGFVVGLVVAILLIFVLSAVKVGGDAERAYREHRDPKRGGS